MKVFLLDVRSLEGSWDSQCSVLYLISTNEEIWLRELRSMLHSQQDLNSGMPATILTMLPYLVNLGLTSSGFFMPTPNPKSILLVWFWVIVSDQTPMLSGYRCVLIVERGNKEGNYQFRAHTGSTYPGHCQRNPLARAAEGRKTRACLSH